MKQTAVDFLLEKYMYLTWLRNRDEISAEQADKMRAEYLAEAKDIQKGEMEKVAGDWWNEGASYVYDGKTKYQSFEQYYNETYGDK
jgi:hypothetical protein